MTESEALTVLLDLNARQDAPISSDLVRVCFEIEERFRFDQDRDVVLDKLRDAVEAEVSAWLEGGGKMRLTDLTVQNFLPYRGEQRLEFPADEETNVIAVFGDNMRGKTSLLSAFRWVFYGEVLDRNRKPRPFDEILNLDARDDGEYEFGVTARFEANGESYELSRHVRPRDLVHRPTGNSDFRVDLFLRRGSTVLPRDAIEHELNLIAPKQTARFFLFDAELLAEYEDLLLEDSQQGRRIREAIEQVLGVPALINGRDELGSLLKRASKHLARDMKHVAGMEALSKEYDDLEDKLGSLRRDHDALREQRRELGEEIAGYDEKLSQTTAAEAAQEELDALQRRLEGLDDELEELRLERLDLTANAWRDLLRPRLQAELDRLLEERGRFQKKMEQRGALQVEVKQLRAIIDTRDCPVCLQEISEDRRTEAGAELGRLEATLRELQDETARVGQLTGDIEHLVSLRGAGTYQGLVRTRSRTAKLLVEQTRLENRQADLREVVAGADTAEIARIRTLRDRLLQTVGVVESKLGKVADDISATEARQAQISKLMTRSPSERLAKRQREVALYRALESLFGDGVDLLRDRLRSAVQQHASEAFAQLTTDKSYSGLEINEVYGLAIVDAKGRKVPQKSAGAEQIVALALIDGLNKTARRRGPIIMDTPLGRLDPRHRENVLKFLPDMAGQVMLLVHEGEVKKDDGLTPLAGRVGARYEIAKVTSSHSEIRSLA